jgi:L-fuculose-phosphate aldolase
MPPIETELREELIEFSNRLAASGLIRGSSGNISVRLDENQILITPTQMPKGYLREADIVLIDNLGKVIRGNHPPSMDTEFHISAYLARPDAQAVIHAHPIITTAFSLVGKSIQSGMLPDFDFFFPKGVPIVPYKPQATQELSEICGSYIAENDIVILSHHGTLAVGHSLMMAWMLTEHLETCFEVNFYAECLSGAKPLTETHANMLREISKRKKTRSR